MNGRGRGRPLVDEPLIRFNIRMTRPQINRLREVAARDGMNFTTWARAAVVRAIEAAEASGLTTEE
ncbi:hypothetical protein BH11GEM2_BH11GEM2_04940 [soil metagenome]